MRSRAAARFSSLHPDSHLQFRELLQTAHKRKLETSVEEVVGRWRWPTCSGTSSSPSSDRRLTTRAGGGSWSRRSPGARCWSWWRWTPSSGEVATTDCDNNNNNGVYSMLPVSTHELVSCPLFIVRCVNINIINLNKINSTIPVRLLILIT